MELTRGSGFDFATTRRKQSRLFCHPREGVTKEMSSDVVLVASAKAASESRIQLFS